MSPQSQQDAPKPSAEEPPQLEMHKRVVKMADGKRDMIYFTFEVKNVRA